MSQDVLFLPRSMVLRMNSSGLGSYLAEEGHILADPDMYNRGNEPPAPIPQTMLPG